jgi:hypothetical protein
MLAQNLYVSDWFIKASSYATQISDQWFILSAKYGLLYPDEEIEPYNETLNNMPVKSRRAWASIVLEDLLQEINEGDQIVFLAGQRYREFLVKPLRSRGFLVEIPMEGLRIGEQLSWLIRHSG